ncbi:WecB/TagA/CpsF family glycosyltransferase [Arthrobacter sp. SO3]|uniref:WecB/TagA/CpsF family glycosyltransferase n=1 Tax=Arthrobacter sp. SO3 TaxID=1897057 RepID=UPI001CFFA8ED|nr:WecB/TagA/CpsF family glycosyltransferase [Arthrobacter sp. SO3]MCB5291211.1 putative N-acetylmannosaminyltransferase [Arthrobacter sp. SO3]
MAPKTPATTHPNFKERQPLGPLQVVATSPKLAALALCEISRDLTSTHVHLVNAYTVALAADSPEYLDTLQGVAINLPDGKPLSWFSHAVGHKPVVQQVRGPQLFLDVFDVGRKFEVKHFLLGSTDDVLNKLKSNLEMKFPGALIVGMESPPFRAMTHEEQTSQDQRIFKSGANIVWIGLGTPKQDLEAQRLSTSTGLTTVAVGAAFDFAAGTVREAPVWMTNTGFEWLFRLLSEPRRLWRRYLLGNLKFIKALVDGHRS